MRYFIAISGTVVFLVAAFLSTASTCAQGSESACAEERDQSRTNLPDYYPYVAADILENCSPQKGIWVDLGSGSGGVGLAIAAADHAAAGQSTIVLLDPDREALSEGLRRARTGGLGHRVVAVVGKAEQMPLPNESVDLVFSRGSVYFWDDPVKGLQEINRVLRPGGAAMIGGGLGTKYPEWARREFTRRHGRNQNSDSPQTKEFLRVRDPKTFQRWAEEAALSDFKVIGQGALPPDDPRAGLGIWLVLSKGSGK